MKLILSEQNLTSIICWLFAILVLLTACSAPENGEPAAVEKAPMSIILTSPAFNNGKAIPQKYSCDVDDISPPLQWVNLPDGTTSVALIVDDPDAPGGTWVHWVLYNISGATNELPENVTSSEAVPGGGNQANNSWNRFGYGGPCPPRGTSHRYFFKLYALDNQLSLSAGAMKEEVLNAMEGHVLAQGQLTGTYQRN